MRGSTGQGAGKGERVGGIEGKKRERKNSWTVWYMVIAGGGGVEVKEGMEG